MRIDILSILPDFFNGAFEHSILKRAKEKGIVDEVFKAFVSALMRGVLTQLRRDLNSRKNYSGDTITKYHFEDLIARIDTAFDRD